MNVKTPSLLTTAATALALSAAPATAQDRAEPDIFSGSARCELATQYFLGNVHVVVDPEAQIACEGNVNLDAGTYGQFSAGIWETRNLANGNTNETDYTLAWSKNDWRLKYGLFDLQGGNYLSQLSLNRSLDKGGSIEGQLLIPETGDTGGALIYNAPGWSTEILGGNLSAAPSLAATRRPGSGQELLTLKGRVNWSTEISDNVNLVLYANGGLPLWAEDGVDRDPEVQAGVAVASSF